MLSNKALKPLSLLALVFASVNIFGIADNDYRQFMDDSFNEKMLVNAFVLAITPDDNSKEVNQQILSVLPLSNEMRRSFKSIQHFYKVNQYQKEVVSKLSKALSIMIPAYVRVANPLTNGNTVIRSLGYSALSYGVFFFASTCLLYDGELQIKNNCCLPRCFGDDAELVYGLLNAASLSVNLMYFMYQIRPTLSMTDVTGIDRQFWSHSISPKALEYYTATVTDDRSALDEYESANSWEFANLPSQLYNYGMYNFSFYGQDLRSYYVDSLPFTVKYSRILSSYLSLVTHRIIEHVLGEQVLMSLSCLEFRNCDIHMVKKLRKLIYSRAFADDHRAGIENIEAKAVIEEIKMSYGDDPTGKHLKGLTTLTPEGEMHLEKMMIPRLGLRSFDREHPEKEVQESYTFADPILGNVVYSKNSFSLGNCSGKHNYIEKYACLEGQANTVGRLVDEGSGECMYIKMQRNEWEWSLVSIYYCNLKEEGAENTGMLVYRSGSAGGEQWLMLKNGLESFSVFLEYIIKISEPNKVDIYNIDHEFSHMKSLLRI